MSQINNIAVFVFDSNTYDKQAIDTIGGINDYLSLYNDNRDGIQYYDSLSKFEEEVNENYMAADTFVKFVAKG